MLILASSAVHCQNNEIPNQVPYGIYPATPAQHLLDKLDFTPLQQLTTTKRLLRNHITIDVYWLNEALFGGWTLEVIENNEHKYRYTKYENGLKVWQIGYFDNGELDHDFHMNDGYNCGSGRMWQKGGGFYIDTFFKPGNVAHGKQLRWHKNGTLARDALYEDGKMIFEVLLDSSGKITKKEGEIPSRYKD